MVKLHPEAYLSNAISLATTIEEAAAPKKYQDLPKKTALGLPTTFFSKESHRQFSIKLPLIFIDPRQQKIKKTQPFLKPIIQPPKRTTNPYQRTTIGKCYRCGQQGHLSNERPQYETIAL